MKTAALFCLVLGMASAARAQKPQDPIASPPKPQMPAGPLLQTAPNYSQWEVVFSYADEQKQDKSTDGKPRTAFTGANARTRKIVTTKTGQIVHEEYTNIAGNVSEMWFNGNNQYQKGGEGKIWFESHPGLQGDQNADPLPANGFRKLDWIVPGNFAGSVPYGRASCLVFTPGGSQKLDLSDPAQQAAKLKAADTVAFIDAETRLPIAVRTKGDLRTYRFEPAPTQVQAFPVDLATQIKQGDEARRRIYAPAPRPN